MGEEGTHIQMDNNFQGQVEREPEPTNNENTLSHTQNNFTKRPDQEETSARGNNDTTRGPGEVFSDEDSEAVVGGASRGDAIPTAREKEAQRVREDKAPHIQIGTSTDCTTPAQHPLLRDLKCAKVRWYRLHLSRGLVALKGKDSIVIEIKYRINEGLDLDPQGKAIHDEHLSDLNIKTKLLEEETRREVPVVKGYYAVNADNTRLEPIYGGSQGKEIQRGVWFLCDEKLDSVIPIDSRIANRIENHLEKFKPTSDESSPEPLIVQKENYKVVWKSVDDAELQKLGSKPVRLVRGHPEEADWNDGNWDVKHLIFLVHGIAHKNKENSILVAAKRLGKGVDVQIKKANADDIRQIMFLPIHWRTLLQIPEGHKCKRSSSTSIWNGTKRRIMKRIHEDLMLYDCVECGPAIRNIVIQQLKSRHEKFRENNPNFTGPISLLGHSLCHLLRHPHQSLRDPGWSRQ